MFEGMKIKIFPDTDVKAYVDLVKSNGFAYKVTDKYILVGKQAHDEEAMKDFARRLRRARRDHRYSRRQLADKIGVREETVYNWEIAYTTPSDKNYKKLRLYLGDF